jgi:hypothetical protein
MSIRHVVLLKFVEGTEPATVEALAAGLRALPARIPELVDYRVGPDLRVAEGTWDFAVTADFASIEDFLTYRDHPDHQAVIHELIAPHVETRMSVQFAT